MTSGICIAAKKMKPEIKIYAVEPKGKDLGASLRAGRRLWEGEPKFLGSLFSRYFEKNISMSQSFE